jgi:hypothetical protein
MTARTRSTWTPERDALLRHLVAQDTARAKCIAPLAALPGKPITRVRQVSGQMNALGISLSPAARAAASSAGGIRGANLVGCKAWTRERNALVLETYPTSEPLADILARVNHLAGSPIASIKAMTIQACRLGVRRPPVQAARAVPRDRQEHRRVRQEQALRRRVAAAAKAIAAAQAKPVLTPSPLLRAPDVRSPEIADAALERKHSEAKRQLTRPGSEPWQVAKRVGLPLREVMRFIGEMGRPCA